MNLKDLTKQIPYKWRKGPGNTNLAYIDARDVMDLLDDVCGPENWQKDYKVLDGKMYCGIGIFINDKWVWKWDMGTESEFEAEKGEASDAFKRAGICWGVGRFLYDIDPTKQSFSQVKDSAKKEVKEMNDKSKPTTNQIKAVLAISKQIGEPEEWDTVEGWTYQQASDYIGSKGNGGYYKNTPTQMERVEAFVKVKQKAKEEIDDLVLTEEMLGGEQEVTGCPICGGPISQKEIDYCKSKGLPPACYNCQKGTNIVSQKPALEKVYASERKSK